MAQGFTGIKRKDIRNPLVYSVMPSYRLNRSCLLLPSEVLGIIIRTRNQTSRCSSSGKVRYNRWDRNNLVI